MKLFSRSVADNAKVVKKINLVDINYFKQRQPIFVGFVCVVHQEDNDECIHQLNHTGMCPKKICNIYINSLRLLQ